MFEKEDVLVYRKLDSPRKIQDFLNTLKTNFEEGGDSCFSPRMVLKHGKAHCVEGAIFAAAALRFHGFEPLILDMESSAKDFDHVIAVFKKHGCLGAISTRGRGCCDEGAGARAGAHRHDLRRGA